MLVLPCDSNGKRRRLQKFRRIVDSEQFGLALQTNPFKDKWVLVYAKHIESGCSRLGMVVSKRLIPRSVDRNRLKRSIREAYRLHFSSPNAQLIVVKVRRTIPVDMVPHFRAALLKLFSEIQLACGN